MTVRPTDIGQLQRAVVEHDHVIPVGGQTAPTLSRTKGDVTRLDMTGLTGVTEYDPSEFVITARAGTPVAEVQQTLKTYGQYLPFDPPWIEAGATFGGTVAAGLSGPGRLRYGGVRDFLIGVRFIDGHGKLIRGGGKVVKNSAGFDLAKLMVGSMGRLGVLTELTFKVFPQPRQRVTMSAECRDLDDALRIMGQLAGGPWDLEALDLEPPNKLILRIAGHAGTLAARAKALAAVVDCPLELLSDERQFEYWGSVTEFAWHEKRACLVKVPVTAGRIPGLEDSLGSNTVQRRYGVAGNVAWLSLSQEFPVEALHDRLTRLGLTGLVIRGEVAAARVGAVSSQDVYCRTKAALDPIGRFPE